jgi:Kef-type K+ transport system membrane component KefB/predicted transcriptional regulator
MFILAQLTNDAVAIGSGALLALILVAGAVGGALARFARLPKVMGYLAGGIALRLGVTAYLRAPDLSDAQVSDAARNAVEPLDPLVDLALGLIVFTLGGVFEVRRLKLVGRRVLRIAVADALMVTGLVTTGCLITLLVTDALPPADELAPSAWTALAVLLGIAALDAAPATTLLVLDEYEAKGPATNAALTMVGLNTVAASVLFFLALLVFVELGIVPARADAGGSMIARLVMATLGSAIIGVGLGLALSVVHVQAATPQTFLLFTAMLLGLSAAQEMLAINYLMTCLLIGAVFANVAMDPGRFETAVRTVGTPIYVAFFALAGYLLHLEESLHLGWLGITYVVARIVGRMIGCWLGTRWARATDILAPTFGAGLLCHAGVVIGLANYLDQFWPGAAARTFHTVILGSVVLFEMLGPPAVRWVAVRSGEVKAVTLMRRTRAAPRSVEGESFGEIVLDLVRRLFRPTGSPQAQGTSSLTARHIMRTNVRFVTAAATLDDVMHFVERSPFNDFPVVDEQNKLIGVIRFGDLRAMFYDPMASQLVTAFDLADTASPVVAVGDSLDAVLEVFRANDIGSVPVVDGHDSRVMLGVLEQRDVLRALHLDRRASDPK